MSWSGRGRKGGRRWHRLRWVALKRDGWRCVKCAARLASWRSTTFSGSKTAALSMILTIVQSLCRSCHVSKTSAERGVIPLPADWTALVDKLTEA